jgi:hypothetical protein
VDLGNSGKVAPRPRAHTRAVEGLRVGGAGDEKGDVGRVAGKGGAVEISINMAS